MSENITETFHALQTQMAEIAAQMQSLTPPADADDSADGVVQTQTQTKQETKQEREERENGIRRGQFGLPMKAQASPVPPSRKTQASPAKSARKSAKSAGTTQTPPAFHAEVIPVRSHACKKIHARWNTKTQTPVFARESGTTSAGQIAIELLDKTGGVVVRMLPNRSELHLLSILSPAIADAVSRIPSPDADAS